MSDLSESRGSGLSDWALVNSQGELEGSDADSNTSSIEVVGRETEEEEDGGHSDLASRESSPECIELEQLMKTADAAVRGEDSAEKENTAAKLAEGEENAKPEGCAEKVTLLPVALPEHGVSAMVSHVPQPAIETVGACSLEMVLGMDKRASSLEKGERERSRERSRATRPALASQLSQDSDSPASSESVLSVSAASNTSRSSRADSDSESDFVRLEKDSSSYVSTESEGEEMLSLTRTNPMLASGSSVGSGFNFLCSTRELQQRPSPRTPQTPPQPLLASLEPPLLAQPPPGEANTDPAQEQEIIAGQEQEMMAAQEEEIIAAQQLEALQAHEYRNVDFLQNEDVHEAELERAQEEEAAPAQDMIVAQEEELDEEVMEEQAEEPEELQAQAVQEPAVEEAEDGAMGPLNDAEDVDDDADTESSTEEGDQDDRIESEQSDDAHSAPPDDLDHVDLSVVNDIGDLPVVRGDVERHYIHYNNQQLNGRLNCVVVAVLVLALGMGLGHWIGSTREHFSQLEIQLSQMKRLHQMQDEYMQCLARNDELLVDSDIALQNERERHQEALTDLRDNNRELQEQLQDAQDRLEQLLTASARLPRTSSQHPSPASLARDLQYALTLSKLLIAGEDQFQESLASWGAESQQQQLLQAREAFTQILREKQAKQRNLLERRLQLEVAEEKRLNSELQIAHRRLNERLNFLEVENVDLRMAVGKMRYKAAGQPGESRAPKLKSHPPPAREPLPPPPRPLPPPPFADAGDVQRALEQREHKQGGSNRKGTQTTPARKLERGTSEHNTDPVFHIPPLFGEGEPEATDSIPQAKHPTQEAGDSAPNIAIESGEPEPGPGPSDEEEEERSEEEAEEAVQQKRLDVPEDQGVKEAFSAKPDCGNGGTPRPIPVDIRLLQRNLTQERQRAEMWRHLYLWEREEKRGMNASGCLHYLMRDVNMSGLMHIVGQWNGSGMEGVKDLTSLVTSIAQLHQHLLHSLPTLWHDLSANLNHLHSDLAQQDADSPPEDRDPQADEGQEEEGEGGSGSEVPPHSRWSFGVKTLLNKTRGTLSNVSRHLQHTWDQVKHVSRHLWPGDDSVFGRLAAHVKDSVSKLSHKVNGKALHWFRKRSKLAKQGVKKGRQEAFSGEENYHKEKKERKERAKEGSRQQTSGREDVREREKRSQFQHKNSDGGEPWKKAHHEEKSRNVSSQKNHHSHHKKEDQFNKHQHRKSYDKEKRKDKHFDKRGHKDPNEEDSKNEMSDKPYHNDSHRRYTKRYHDSKHQGDPHYKETDRKKYHQKETKDKKNEEQNYHREKDREEKNKYKKEAQKENKHRHPADHREPQFSTKAKHHSSHEEKAADKAKHKIQKRFHKLFSKIGAMSQKSYHSMDWDDLGEMLEDMTEVFRVYQDSRDLGLPHSGFLWLQCQIHFWSHAERHRVRYDPEDQCLQFLAPWQIGFVVELGDRVGKGECRKVRRIPCVDVGVPEDDVERYYRYVCSDDKHHDDDDDDDDDDDNNDCHVKSKKQGSKVSPKGQRERENRKSKLNPQEPWSTDSTKEGSASKRVNHSDQESQAWYFHWVEGRNNLRSAEHKADWLFERASERGKNREEERRANWMFDRASERDKLREQEHESDWMPEQADDRQFHDEDDEDDDERRKDEDSGWREASWREKRGSHKKKDGRFQHHRKHLWHRDASHNMKYEEKDYRQKYGRTHF